MKIFKFILPALVFFFSFINARSQNVQINILTQNSGIVNKGKTGFVEVTINNTDPNTYVGPYKLKVQISIPSAIVKISPKEHVLPTGWTVISTDESSVTFSNGKDFLASRDGRTILIAIKGNSLGGPSSISGNLSFSNGEAPGTEPGTLQGDNPADNVSTTTCKVIN